MCMGKKYTFIIFLLAVLFVFLTPSQLDLNKNVYRQETLDTDNDGISDEVEEILGTNKTDKYGDYDEDGLYDFEEYLDIYGTPNNIFDTPRFAYNINSTYGDLLDIYSYFAIEEEKTAYIRDGNYTPLINTSAIQVHNILFWNTTIYASKIEENATVMNYTLSYENNFMVNTTYSNIFAGGSKYGSVTYLNNVINNGVFYGAFSGGSQYGSVTYINNIINNGAHSGAFSGGSQYGSVTYLNNVINNGVYSGAFSGGSQHGPVTYRDNIILWTEVSATYAGGSKFGPVVYMDNTLNHTTYGSSAGRKQ